MNGWIKISRKIVEWEWFDNPLMVKAWVWMLTQASYEIRNWRGIELEPGQFITTVSQMSQTLNLSLQQTRTIISNMQTTRQITLKSTNRYTIITICNYALYQCDDCDLQQTNQQANQQTNQQTNNTPSNNIERIKNITKKDILSKESLSKESKKPYSKPDFVADLESLGIQRQTALDWCTAREKKNLAYTKSAFNGTVREIKKVQKEYPQITAEELIGYAAWKCWGGFEARYYFESISRTSNGYNQQHTGNRKAIPGDGNYESTL